jgi:CRP-like cAMP-binding protein
VNNDVVCSDLKEILFFKSLPDEMIEKFCHIAVFEAYEDGDIVYREGDAADAFYIVLQGEAFALKKIDADKEEKKSIGVVTQGDILGQISGIGDNTRFVTLKAKGMLKMMKVSRVEMVKFLEEDRKMATRFLLEFIGRLYAIVRSITAEQIALYETGRLIASSRSEEELIGEIVAIIKRGAPAADSGFIALHNAFTDEFEIRAGKDSQGNSFVKSVFTQNEPLVKHLTEQRRFFEGNPSKDAQIWDEAFAQAVAALCYPILSGQKLLGFITLFSTEKEDAFAAEQKNFLIGICNMLAPALEAAELKREEDRRALLGRHMY